LLGGWAALPSTCLCGLVLLPLWLPTTGIFGEYDRYFMPSIVDKAASGKLKYIIGDGKNCFDWTYAGNVAQAHEMACRTFAGRRRGGGGGDCCGPVTSLACCCGTRCGLL